MGKARQGRAREGQLKSRRRCESLVVLRAPLDDVSRFILVCFLCCRYAVYRFVLLSISWCPLIRCTVHSGSL